MQRRYFDFITDMSQINLANYLRDILPYGIHAGCELIVRNERLYMAAGRYITSNGLIIEETEEVEIANLTDTYEGTSQLKTVLGLGPQLNSVMSGAIEYIINEGVATPNDLRPLNQPFIILGFVYFDGTHWRSRSVSPVELQYRGNAHQLLTFPLPGVNGLLEVIPEQGTVEAVALNTSGKTLRVPLNNRHPLKRVSLEVKGSTPGISVTLSVQGSRGGKVMLPARTVGEDGQLLLDAAIEEPGMFNALLELHIVGLGSPANEKFRISQLSYEQDYSYFSIAT